MHIVSELVEGLEGELDAVHDGGNEPSSESSGYGDTTSVQYGDQPSELGIFDSLTGGDSNAADEYESADQEWQTHVISAAMSRNEDF